MVTRSQRGIIKPLERLSLHTSSVSPIPKSLFLALKDPNWCNAMYDKYDALFKNDTWILVPRSTDANLVWSMWLFKHRFHADGTLSRYKAGLVANDDIILTACSPALLQQIVDSLHKEFDMTDLRALNYFLGISTVRHLTGEPHFAALKRILRYVQGTLELGLHLYASATTCLLGYTNADWAGGPSTRSDNVSAIYMSANLVQHHRTKHIKIDIHFVHDMVKDGHVCVLHVSSRYQYADIFTKGLPSALFEDFRSSLSVHPPPAQIAGA
nr:ribonuclease H-like domain-containing protein [Tanacetum cinerariifolium]